MYCAKRYENKISRPPKNAPTAKENTITMMVFCVVSRREGKLVFLSSDRTSRKNAVVLPNIFTTVSFIVVAISSISTSIIKRVHLLKYRQSTLYYLYYKIISPFCPLGNRSRITGHIKKAPKGTHTSYPTPGIKVNPPKFLHWGCLFIKQLALFRRQKYDSGALWTHTRAICAKT